MVRLCVPVRALVALGVICSAAASVALPVRSALAQGYDAIGATPAQTNTNAWLASSTNTDIANNWFTAAGSGVISVPAGRRINAFRAVMGGKGPVGAGPGDFSVLNSWEVHLWDSQTAFIAAPRAGNRANIAYTAPSSRIPWGVDNNGNTAFLCTFLPPGGITVPTTDSYFSVRANASFSNVGQFGVLESSQPGPSGVIIAPGLTQPFPFTFFFDHKFDGVLAYQIVVGCPGDFNADSTVDVNDIFAFLGAWFANVPAGNYNGDSARDVNDIFAFLAAWFTRCV